MMRSDAQKKLATSKASAKGGNTPISILTDDLLEMIFKECRFYTHAYSRQPRYPIFLAHVCLRWRIITLQTGSLWSYILLKTKAPFSSLPSRRNMLRLPALYLERAQNTLLDIRIHDPYGSVPCVKRVLEFITPHAGRWRQFIADFGNVDTASAVLQTLETLPVPELRHIHLCLMENPDADNDSEDLKHLSHTLFQSGAPRLSTVRLGGALALQRCMAPLEHVRCLDLFHGSLHGIGGITHGQLRLLLQSAPRLEELALFSSIVKLTRIDALPDIPLANLKQLRFLRGNGNRVSRNMYYDHGVGNVGYPSLLASFRTPKLEFLHIDRMEGFGEFIAWMSMIQCSIAYSAYATVRTLMLTGIMGSINASVLSAAFPSLEHLDIWTTSGNNLSNFFNELARSTTDVASMPWPHLRSFGTGSCHESELTDYVMARKALGRRLEHVFLDTTGSGTFLIEKLGEIVTIIHRQSLDWSRTDLHYALWSRDEPWHDTEEAFPECVYDRYDHYDRYDDYGEDSDFEDWTGNASD